MANLDLTYYHGLDQYSDGDETENRLLQIVQEGKTLDDLSLGEVSWPILYHLHPVRENICNWYPFRKGSRILEIGAGCGAVTGALCRSGCNVYSVDLSERRSRINYERHKGYDNLHIMVGNLNDMTFDGLFDYIVLIGVLEYAGRFTEDVNPYEAFLKNICKLLKPTGRLLIAIENRLGLKYFAGAKEDHLGKPFAGIDNYKPDEGVRTFSRTEMQELLKQNGFADVRFYYPYPDYKFPLEIFGEEEMSSGRYGKEYYPVDEPRCALFSEPGITKTLISEDAVRTFANSFFVEAAPSKPDDEDGILYVKLNNDRKSRFRIGTMIRKNGKNREVIKYPLTETAENHIQNMHRNEVLLGQDGNTLQGTMTSEGLAYPFISDPTADALLERMLDKNDREGILSLLDEVYRLISDHPKKESYSSEQFTEWFGDERTGGETVLCANPANIDMILDNIFHQGTGYTMLDCEWVADFPVPAAFIMWRTLESAMHYHPELEKMIPKKELFERFQIQDEDEPVYSAWSSHFEAEYAGNNSLSRFSKGIRIVEFDQERVEYLQARIHQLEETEAELQENVRQAYSTVAELQESVRQACSTEAELRQQIFDRQKESDEMKWQIEYGTARIGQLEETEKALREELQRIHDSRFWKMGAAIRKALSVFKR